MKTAVSAQPYAESIESLAAFISFVDQHCALFDHVLFRGQRQDWALLPKIARLRLRDEVNVLKAEASMVASLKSRALPLLDFSPETDWDWLAIAQHHGMATRLLDWTTNPLAAPWFAVEKPAIAGNDGVVWVFTHADEDRVSAPAAVSPFELGRTRVFQPRHINRRIVAQHGWFTVHHYQTPQKRFVPMQKHRQYKTRLMKIRVPATTFATLRYELDRCGINGATLYGDLVGLCQDAEWQHSLLDDEDSP